MQLSITSEYAIRTMLFMAGKPMGVSVQISEISKACEIPENYLRKIVPILTKAKLLITNRGNNGGVEMGKNPRDISLLNVVEVIEGKLVFNKCLLYDNLCGRDVYCSVHSVWKETQLKITEILSSKNIEQLAQETENNFNSQFNLL